MTRDVAKVFMSGRSQAVRIPMEFRFSTPEVLVMRKGEDAVLAQGFTRHVFVSTKDFRPCPPPQRFLDIFKD